MRKDVAMLTGMCEEQGTDGALCDSGYSGSALCGEKRLKQLQQSQVVSLEEVPHEGIFVRFGGGSAETFQTFKLHILPWKIHLQLGVVKGALPLLVGLVGFRAAGIMVSSEAIFRVESGKLFQIGETQGNTPCISLGAVAGEPQGEFWGRMERQKLREEENEEERVLLGVKGEAVRTADSKGFAKEASVRAAVNSVKAAKAEAALYRILNESSMEVSQSEDEFDEWNRRLEEEDGGEFGPGGPPAAQP